jgi:cold shock CspA family protein
MQATVSSFDAPTASGTVLLDDGVEVPFAAAALAESGLRLLRPGQRVRLVMSGGASTPTIEKLQIITLA